MFRIAFAICTFLLAITLSPLADAAEVVLYEEDFEDQASGFDDPDSFAIIDIGTQAEPDWIGSFTMASKGAVSANDTLPTPISLPVGAEEIDLSFEYGFATDNKNNVRVGGYVRFLDANGGNLGLKGGGEVNNFGRGGGQSELGFSHTISVPETAVAIDIVQARFIQIVRDQNGEQPVNPPNTAYFDNVKITAIPEPGSVGLMTIGVLLIVARRRS
jgi:hypothetical protein